MCSLFSLGSRKSLPIKLRREGAHTRTHTHTHTYITLNSIKYTHYVCFARTCSCLQRNTSMPAGQRARHQHQLFLLSARGASNGLTPIPHITAVCAFAHTANMYDKSQTHVRTALCPHTAHTSHEPYVQLSTPVFSSVCDSQDVHRANCIRVAHSIPAIYSCPLRRRRFVCQETNIHHTTPHIGGGIAGSFVCSRGCNRMRQRIVLIRLKYVSASHPLA